MAGDNLGKIRENFKAVKENVEGAKMSAELAATLAIYDKVLQKISKKSNTPSAPGSPPRMKSGRLYKGTVRVTQRGFADGAFQIIGFQPPASHAHLLEFGTPHMAPRPFFMAAYQESLDDAIRSAKYAFKVQLERGEARIIGKSKTGTQESGARYHNLHSVRAVYDIIIEFYRAGDHIGYSLTRGGQSILSEDFSGGGLTFNDLIPDAMDAAERLK